jgi:hypothetical protein
MSDIVNSGDYELRSDELREEISSLYGSEVELMNLKHRIFDEACISVISLGTVHSVERESGRDVYLRRFRPNWLASQARHQSARNVWGDVHQVASNGSVTTATPSIN